jgi:hypothetical protein
MVVVLLWFQLLTFVSRRRSLARSLEVKKEEDIGFSCGLVIDN